MIESLMPSLEQTLDKTKEQAAKWEDTIDNIPMPDIEQYEMSLEEAQQAFTDTFEEGISGLKLTAEETSTVSNEVFNTTQESINELATKMGEKVPDFDYTEIGKSAAISAVAGGAGGSLAGGIGAAPGAIGGGIAGATGEILGQIAKYNGASDGLAMSIQIGTELFTFGGIVKLAGKGIAKVSVSSVDDVVVFANGKGIDTITKLGDIVDNTMISLGDKIKATGYEVKGFVNNNKIHQFTDGYGGQFPGEISDVIDMSRTIKMPYLGSNLNNTNAAGFLRDSSKFGRDFLEKFPETMSKNNTARIENGLSPITDKLFIKFNPNHKTFIGQTLEHHHINNTGSAGYIPTGLHRLGSNKEIMHVDNMNLLSESMSLAKNKILRS